MDNKDDKKRVSIKYVYTPGVPYNVITEEIRAFEQAIDENKFQILRFNDKKS